MILESLTVAQAQLGDALAETDGCGTIQTDGTTKYGQHYATYDVKMGSITYSLDLRHVFSFSSCNIFHTLTLKSLFSVNFLMVGIGH